MSLIENFKINRKGIKMLKSIKLALLTEPSDLQLCIINY